MSRVVLDLVCATPDCQAFLRVKGRSLQGARHEATKAAWFLVVKRGLSYCPKCCMCGRAGEQLEEQQQERTKSDDV